MKRDCEIIARQTRALSNALTATAIGVFVLMVAGAAALRWLVLR